MDVESHQAGQVLLSYAKGSCILSREDIPQLVRMAMRRANDHPLRNLHQVFSLLAEQGRGLDFVNDCALGWGFAMADLICHGYTDSIRADGSTDYRDNNDKLRKWWKGLELIALEVCAQQLVLRKKEELLPGFILAHEKDPLNSTPKICRGIAIALESIFSEKGLEKAQETANCISSCLIENGCWSTIFRLSQSHIYPKHRDALSALFQRSAYAHSSRALQTLAQAEQHRDIVPLLVNILCAASHEGSFSENLKSFPVSEAASIIKRSCDLGAQLRLGAIYASLWRSADEQDRLFLEHLNRGLDSPPCVERTPAHSQPVL